MRYTGRKGWQVSRKDCYDLGESLKPIIAAGLRKFLEEVNHNMFGVPNEFIVEGDWLQGLDNWIEALNKMIYAFGTEEPCLTDYDYNVIFVDEDGNEVESLLDVEANVGYTTKVTNEAEKLRYYKDLEEHQAKVDEGLELFGKHYRSLWW